TNEVRSKERKHKNKVGNALVRTADQMRKPSRPKACKKKLGTTIRPEDEPVKHRCKIACLRSIWWNPGRYLHRGCPGAIHSGDIKLTCELPVNQRLQDSKLDT
ncbi:hypothetical protein HAX54_030074, partial [Datura stramonium]|nr:hypothetical protein [Datura stramonium]